jgi:Peptidase family S51
MKQNLLVAFIAMIALIMTSCGNPNDNSIPLTSETIPPILLFNGTGTSGNDVAAFERVLDAHGFKYSKANSPQMNDMSESRLRSYRLLIIPGGNFEHIGDGLRASTTAKIHDAVQNGLNYLGVCAGGLIAGRSTHNGLDLTGVRFGFYSAVNRGIHKEAVEITGPDVPALDQYWEDGPQFTGWGEFVAKYPDGTPALVQGRSGAGWLVLCGFHPEAPASWRRGMNFKTPASVDNDYAATLIQAALDATRLPHF